MSCPGYHIDGLQQLSKPFANNICSSCNKPLPTNQSIYGCKHCLYSLCVSCFNIQQFVFDDLKSNDKPNPPLKYRPGDLINAEQESKIIHKMINLCFSTNSEWQTYSQSHSPTYTLQSLQSSSFGNHTQSIYRGQCVNHSSITLHDYHEYLTLGHQIHKTSIQYATSSQIIIGKNHEVRHDKFYHFDTKTYPRDTQYMLTRFKIPSYYINNDEYTIIGLIAYSIGSTHKLYTKPSKHCQRILIEPEAKICYQSQSTLNTNNKFTFCRLTYSPNYFLMQFNDTVLTDDTLNTFHHQCQSIEHTLQRNQDDLDYQPYEMKQLQPNDDILNIGICESPQLTPNSPDPEFSEQMMKLDKARSFKEYVSHKFNNKSPKSLPTLARANSVTHLYEKKQSAFLKPNIDRNMSYNNLSASRYLMHKKPRIYSPREMPKSPVSKNPPSLKMNTHDNESDMEMDITMELKTATKSQTPKFAISPKFWNAPSMNRVLHTARTPFSFKSKKAKNQNPFRDSRPAFSEDEVTKVSAKRMRMNRVKYMEKTQSSSSDSQNSSDEHTAHSLLTAYNRQKQQEKRNYRPYANSTIQQKLKTQPANPLDPKIFPCPKSEWIPDSSTKRCMCCNEKFGRKKMFKSGKHHCRKCGNVVCKRCSKRKLKGHRVCYTCYNRYKQYSNMRHVQKPQPNIRPFLNKERVSVDEIHETKLDIGSIDSSNQESLENEYFDHDSSDTDNDMRKALPLARIQTEPLLHDNKQKKHEQLVMQQIITRGFANVSFDLFMESCSMNVGVNRKYLDKFYENGYDDIRMMEFIDRNVLLDEIGFKNKLSMNLILKRVQWLKDSQIEFKEILLNKLKLPKRYLLLFNEKGIVNMEYLVRFITNREMLRNQIGITIEKHLDKLTREMRQYQNGIYYKMSIDLSELSEIRQQRQTPRYNDRNSPSLLQREGRKSTTYRYQPGAKTKDAQTPASHDDLYLTPGDLGQTTPYITDDNTAKQDDDDEEEKQDSDGMDGSETTNVSEESLDDHLRILCDLQMNTKGQYNQNETTQELSHQLMSKEEIIDEWNALKKGKYSLLYNRIKDYHYLFDVVMKCYQILVNLKENEQSKHFDESINLAMINMEYLYHLKMKQNDEVTNDSYLFDIVEERVLREIEDGLKEFKVNEVKEGLTIFIIKCCQILWSVINRGYYVSPNKFRIQKEHCKFDEMIHLREGDIKGNRVKYCVFPAIMMDNQYLTKIYVICKH